MNTLNDMLSSSLLRAAGFTLLHSLWQGAVVAVGASLLLGGLHRHCAAVRYRVLLSALVLLVGMAVVTFGSYWVTGALVTSSSFPALATSPLPGIAAAHGGGASNGTPTYAGADNQIFAVGTTYVERHLPLLVGAWALGLLAMTLRLLAGFAYVRRLRGYRVAALPATWQQRVDELCAKAGLTQRVQVMASALVPSPVVVGYLKPVILLPVSAATGLSPRELEMILAHEVAHVLRRDYLVNLLQALAEVVFFYHPAVWFLSAGLRTEREYCCDEVATQLCGDPRTLAQALSSLAELAYTEAHTPRLVLAATGSGGRGRLLGRVRRLLTPAPPAALGGLWAACLTLASAALLVGSMLAALHVSAHSAGVAAIEVPVPHLTPDDLLEAELERDGLLPNPHHYEYTLRANRLVVNGIPQPAAVAAKYRRLYEVAADEKLWPLISSEYRHVQEDDTPCEEAH